jgi:hypothetical protein
MKPAWCSWSIFFGALLAALLCVSQHAYADVLKVRVSDTDRTLYKQRFALLIGASDYQQGWDDLPEIPDELDSLRAELVAQGFDAVEILPNPRAEQLAAAIQSFLARRGTKDAALLIAFSGHGWLDRSSGRASRGYLVPVDAPLPSQDRAGFLAKALSMGSLRTLADQSEAIHTLFLLDSCYSGSIFTSRDAVEPPDRVDISIPRFEALKAPGVQFITAGAADARVPGQSKFMRMVVSAINGNGGADLNQDGFVTATELGYWLKHDNNLDQNPQFGDLGDGRRGDFVFQPSFKPSPRPVPTAKYVAELGGGLAPPPVDDLCERASRDWAVVEKTQSVDVARAYLAQTPQSCAVYFVKAQELV